MHQKTVDQARKPVVGLFVNDHVVNYSTVTYHCIFSAHALYIIYIV